MKPTNIDQTLLRAKARHLMQTIQEIADLTGMAVYVVNPLDFLKSPRIEVYLSKEDFKLYKEAEKELEK